MKHTEYLKKKKRRETRKRIISILAAFVVFVATYALVLPALTLDVNTARMEPGMSVQQSADPEAVSAPESSEVEESEPEEEKSVEAEEPADEEEPEKEQAPAKEEESAKDEEAAKAEEQASDEQAGSAAAQKEEPSSKEDQDDAAAANTDAAAESVDQTGSDAADENAEATAADEADAFKVPELEAVDFSEILTDKTDFYYYHEEISEEEGSEDTSKKAAVSSTDIDDWKKVKDDTVLAPEDFVRVYLAYTIPAGALNETNTVARYRLPDGLELTDKQIKAINKNENGISGKDKDAADYKKYLGAEAIEGTRTPDQILKAGTEEYISATVKVEKVYDEDGKYLGQDLIFTFVPYTVQKNQIGYDEKGNVKSEGKAVKGWFSFDLTPSRIGFEEVEKEADGDEAEIDAEADGVLVRSKAKITFVKENKEKDIEEISRELTLEGPAGALDNQEEADQAEQKTLTFEGTDYTAVVYYTEDAEIPDNAELTVSEIKKDSDEYNEYLERARGAVDEDKTINEAEFFDITIIADGEEVEPASPIDVEINFAGIEQTKAEDARLLHYKEDEVQIVDQAEFRQSEEADSNSLTVNTVQFRTDGFSIYGIVGLIDEKEKLMVYEGDDFTIAVTFDGREVLPEGLALSAEEIKPETPEYDELVGSANEMLNLSEEDSITTARFFDIVFSAGDEIFEPVYPTSVQITYEEALVVDETQELSIIHFGEEETELITDVNLNEEQTEITYEQESFSIVGVVVSTNSNNYWPDRTGDYVMVVGNAARGYYIIDHNLNAVRLDSFTQIDNETAKIVTGNNVDDNNKGQYLWTLDAAANANNTQGRIKIPGTNNYLDFLADALISTSQRNYRWNQNRRLYTTSQQGNRYFTITDQGKLGYTTDQNNALDVYFAAWDITLNVFPCVYDESISNHGPENNNIHNYLPDREDLTVTIPGEDFTVYTQVEDGQTITYYRFPVEYLSDVLRPYGFDPKKAACPFVNGVSLNTFKTEVVKNYNSNGTLDQGNNPWTDSYVTIEGTKYVVIQKRPGDDANAKRNWKNIYYAVLSEATDTVNPSGTVINFFDYWTTGQNDEDASRDSTAGINNGHVMHFFFNANNVNTGGGTYSGNGQVNNNTVGGGVTQGIVANKLVNGYPALSGAALVGGSTESLDYLFDPTVQHAGKASYTNVSNLLSLRDGFFWYDGKYRGVEYDPTTGDLIEYTTPVSVAGGGSPYGQFFPFENAHQMAIQSNIGRGIQHYFGMNMTTKFTQVYGGYTDPTKDKEVVFHYSGDDDMWIFIDDVLVADLGGTHSANDLKINFRTGEITIEGVRPNKTTQTRTILQMFQAAGSEDIVTWNGNTFADETSHTLKMFYMERGNWDSTLSLEFNMVDIKPTAIYKVDQYGMPVAGAEFSVYRANSNYRITQDTPVYRGVTDIYGELVFVDNNGLALTQVELKQLFGDHFVLRETAVPVGYQSMSEDVHLRFDGSKLICDNTQDSAAYASNNLLITSPTTLKNASTGDTFNFYTTGNSSSINGSLFAVVLKKNGDGRWHPIFGNAESGFTVESGTGIADVIDARNKQIALDGKDNGVYFSFHSGGVMQVGMDNLPGDINQYAEGGSTNPTYKIGYYWTDGENTYQVEPGGNSQFDTAWGATIRVPNYENRVYFQKVSDDETKAYVNGAKFALYAADSETGTKYRNTANEYIELGNNYEINASTGVITVKDNDGNTTSTIQPIDIETTSDYNVSTDVILPGTGSFDQIKNGKYLMREISVPDPYALNTADIQVDVNTSNINVHAGTANDGVIVYIEPGRLAPSMFELVNGPGLNESLSWIIAESNGSRKNLVYDYSDGSVNSVFDYMIDGEGLSDIRFSTDTGWSDLTITQDHSHQGEAEANGSVYTRYQGDISHLFGKALFAEVTDEKEYEIYVKKIDLNTNQPLQGVKFDLYRGSIAPANKLNNNTLVSDENGKLELGRLGYGSYILNETEPLDGYEPIAPITITINRSGVTFVQEGNPLIARGDAIDKETKETSTGIIEVYTLTVINTNGVVLPHTGGPGTSLYTLGGIALIMASALMYGFRMRRRERRFK